MFSSINIASAHVSISSVSSTSEGSRFELEFRIPHGCDHNDTREIVIPVPAEVMANGVITLAKGPWTNREVDTAAGTVTYKGGLFKISEFTKETIRRRWPTNGVATKYELPVTQTCTGNISTEGNNPPPSVTVTP